MPSPVNTPVRIDSSFAKLHSSPLENPHPLESIDNCDTAHKLLNIPLDARGTFKTLDIP